MAITTLEQRVPNFAERKQWRCLHCGKTIDMPFDLYSRRFCSIDCKEEYFSYASNI